MTFEPTGKDCVNVLNTIARLLTDSITLERAIVDAEKEGKKTVHLVLCGNPNTIKLKLENISKFLEGELFGGETSTRIEERRTGYSTCFMTEYRIIPQGGARCKYPDIKITSYGLVSRFCDIPF